MLLCEHQQTFHHSFLLTQRVITNVSNVVLGYTWTRDWTYRLLIVIIIQVGPHQGRSLSTNILLEDWEIVAGPQKFCSNGHLHRHQDSGNHRQILLTPAQEFHCFMNLPFELRQKIWLFNFPDPRIHRLSNIWRTQLNQVYLDSSIVPMDYDEDWEYVHHNYQLDPDRCRSKSSSMWMNLRSICREASQVFNKVFIKIELKGSSIAKLWDSSAADERSDFGGIPTIHLQQDFFNKSEDTLYLPPEAVAGLLESWSWIDLSQIRHLAVGVDATGPNQHTDTWTMLTEAQNLKSLTLLVGRCMPSQYELASSYHLVDLESLPNAMPIQLRNLSSTYQELESYSKLTDDLRKQLFRDRPSSEQNYPSFSIRTATVGSLWEEPMSVESHWVVPKNKQAYRQYFYVHQRALPGPYYMTIDLGPDGIYLQCDSDGSLLDPLDGFPRLFEEQGI